MRSIRELREEISHLKRFNVEKTTTWFVAYFRQILVDHHENIRREFVNGPVELKVTFPANATTTYLLSQVNLMTICTTLSQDYHTLIFVEPEQIGNLQHFTFFIDCTEKFFRTRRTKSLPWGFVKLYALWSLWLDFSNV